MSYNIEKISKKDKDLLDSFESKYSIDPYLLAYHYGLKFAMDLINSVIPKKYSQSNSFQVIKPRGLADNFMQDFEKRKLFLQNLINAGLKIRTWTDNGIDEATGKIVPMYRCEIFYVEHGPTKNLIHHA